MKGRILCFRLFFCLAGVTFSIGAHAQSIVVFDNNGSPLFGAHIQFANFSEKEGFTIITDELGVIPNSQDLSILNSNWNLTIKYVGFQPLSAKYIAFSDTAYYLEPDEITLNQVVITGQHSPNNPEAAVQKIKVIDSKRIEAQGAVNLRDVLQNETNIRLGEDNILGSSASVQGISGQNVKILIDGVPVTGRLDGNIDLSQLNMNNVERVEIVEGPLSVNYGTDALAGTINIITKQNQEELFKGSVNSFYESAGQYNLDASAGISIDNHLFTMNGGRYFFDGWSENDKFFAAPGIVPEGEQRNQQWNPKEQIFGGLQYKYSGEKWNLRPFADWYFEEIVNRGTPRGPDFDNAFDDYFRTKRFNYGVNFNGDLSSNTSINIIAAYNYYNRIKNTYFKDLTTLSEVLTENPSEQDTTTFNVWMSRGSLIYNLNSISTSMELGYDINHETALGQRIETGTQEQGDYAIFASAEYKAIDGLIIRPGLRFAYNTNYEAPLVPSINIRHKWKGFTIRASYAKGFRAPSLKELYFEFVDINHNILGNTNLEAETSGNFNLNIGWQQVKDQKILKLEIGAFYNDINDLISLAQNDDASVFSYINVGTFKSLGTQSNIEYARKHLKLSFGGSIVGRYNEFFETSTSGQFDYSPEVRSSILYEWHSAGIDFGIFYKYNGELPNYFLNENNEVELSTISDYHMFDVTISKSFINDHLKWTIGGQNLFNVQNLQTTSGATGGTHASNTSSVPLSWGRSLITSIKINI